MSEPAITYAPRPDATPEGEMSALAKIYEYVLNCSNAKEAAPESRPEDARKDQDARTRISIPKQ